MCPPPVNLYIAYLLGRDSIHVTNETDSGIIAIFTVKPIDLIFVESVAPRLSICESVE